MRSSRGPRLQGRVTAHLCCLLLIAAAGFTPVPVVATTSAPVRASGPVPESGLVCDPTIWMPSADRPGDYVVRDHFESGSLAKWTVTDEGDAWAGATDDVARRGLCAGRLIVSSSSTSRANVRTWLPEGSTDAWAIGWFRVLSEGYSGSNVPTFRFFDGSKRIVDVHRQNGSGDLWLRSSDGHGSWRYVHLGMTVSLKSWHRVAIHVEAGWSAGAVAVYVDDELRFRDDSYYVAASRISTVMVGAEHVRQKMDLVFDDIVVKAS